MVFTKRSFKHAMVPTFQTLARAIEVRVVYVSPRDYVFKQAGRERGRVTHRGADTGSVVR
jgi:hypothetical protein